MSNLEDHEREQAGITAMCEHDNADPNPAIRPYKAGDVQSGNWTWAVGIKPTNEYQRPIQLVSINHHACHRRGIDPEAMAHTIAAALQHHPDYRELK